jgi:stage II sporulation protein M
MNYSSNRSPPPGMSIKEQVQYFHRLRSYLLTSVVLLGLGVLVGVAIIAYYTGAAQQLENELSGFVKIFRELPKLQLLTAIFLNNALKTFIVIIFGMFFGVIPVLFLLVNGAAVGVAITSATQSRGLWESLLAILPHGVLELPAVLLGTSIGLMIGGHSIRRIFGTADTTLGTELGRALKFFVAVIIPLLILAALVEAFITPVVAGI